MNGGTDTKQTSDFQSIKDTLSDKEKIIYAVELFDSVICCLSPEIEFSGTSNDSEFKFGSRDLNLKTQ